MARYWEWEDPFKINPEETALLIVDMQKGFTQESGPLFTPQCKEQLPVIADLKSSAMKRTFLCSCPCLPKM